MPDDRAARVGIPVRRAEPGEGGHEVHAAGVGDGRGERLDVRRRRDRARAHRAATGRPSPPRTPSPRARRSTARPAPAASRRSTGGRARTRAPPRPCSGAGTRRCRRCSSPGPARSTPARTSPPAGRRRARRSGSGGRRAPARSRRRRPTSGAPRAAPRPARRRASSSSSSQREPVDVEQQRPARVRDVRRVDRARRGGPAGQPPEQERVDRAERELAALGTGASAGHGVEDVRDLRAAEVRVQGQARSAPGRAARGRPRAGAAQAGAVIRLCQTIASAIGSPVARSQTIVVSRWFVIPIAAIRSAPPTSPDDLLRDRRAGSTRSPPGRG